MKYIGSTTKTRQIDFNNIFPFSKTLCGVYHSDEKPLFLQSSPSQSRSYHHNHYYWDHVFAKETWQDLHQSKRHCGWTLACKYLRPQDGHPHHNHRGHHAKRKMQISEATWWSIGHPHHNHYDGHHCLWGKLSDADEEGDLGQRGPRADAEGMIRQPQWSSRL